MRMLYFIASYMLQDVASYCRDKATNPRHKLSIHPFYFYRIVTQTCNLSHVLFDSHRDFSRLHLVHAGSKNQPLPLRLVELIFPGQEANFAAAENV